MRGPSAGLIVILAALPLAACEPSRGEAPHGVNPLLDEPAPRPPAVEAAARSPDELLRTLTAPHRHSAARLGPHVFRGTHAVRVVENGHEVEALDEESAIEHAEGGAFHARYANSRDYGREAYHDRGTIWIRPLHGKFHRRPVTSADEAPRLVDEIFGGLGADFELVAHAASLTDAGAGESGGRPTRRVRLSLGAPRPRPAQTEPARAWRDGVTVLALDGEVNLDVATGAVLEGHLATRVAFVRSGRSFELSLEADHRVTEVGRPIVVSPPSDADSVATPGRAHDFEDREELLDGLAPPATRAPAPGAH